MISYAVVGHFKRAKQASELAHALVASLSLDDGTYGSNENHARAWRSRPNKDGWVVVLEDDAIPVDNFKGQVRNALANLPQTTTPVGTVSIYEGGGKPIPTLVPQASHDANSE